MHALEKDKKEPEEVLDLGKLEVRMKDLLGVFTEIESIKSKPLIIRRLNGDIYEYHPSDDFKKQVKRLVVLQTLAFERKVILKPYST